MFQAGLMAAQLRSAGPSPSPFLHAHAPISKSFRFPSTRAHRFATDPCPSSLSFPAFKHCRPSSAYSPSLTPTSSTVADGTEGPELGGNGEGGIGGGGSWNGGGGGDWHDDYNSENEDSRGSSESKGMFGALLQGWDERVRADPQFPFKVLMEQIVGVGAAVIGDMASRPNFGLNELDFVFSTLVVGSIVNFSLMYVLAPTSAASTAAVSLPWIFSSSPSGHMFEHGAYTVVDRLGTFVYKGAVFAAVGFGAGLFGTFLSNCLIGLRKRMDPTFVPQNKAPPTLLNAATWAIHMGVSSNLRYQVINGMEFSLANSLPPPAFKASVLFIRAFNNVLGGFSFVTLARLTGSQKKAEATDACSPIERVTDAQRSQEQANMAEMHPPDIKSTVTGPQKLGLNASAAENELSGVGVSPQSDEPTSNATLISEMDISKPRA